MFQDSADLLGHPPVNMWWRMEKLICIMENFSLVPKEKKKTTVAIKKKKEEEEETRVINGSNKYWLHSNGVWKGAPLGPSS